MAGKSGESERLKADRVAMDPEFVIQKLELVEQVGCEDTWPRALRAQWGGRVSCRVLGTGSHVLATTVPAVFGDGLEACFDVSAPLAVLTTGFVEANPTVLVEVCRYGPRATCEVLCRTSVDLGTLCRERAAGRSAVETVIMTPQSAVTDTTILCAITYGVHAFAAPGSAPLPISSSVMDYYFGNLRLSATELTFPAAVFAFPDPSVHLISNAVCVGNATEQRVLAVRLAASDPVLQILPSELLLGPRQRAYFSVTLRLAAGEDEVADGRQLALAASRARVTVIATDTASSDTQTTVQLPVRIGDRSQGAAYQFWVNGTCCTNRMTGGDIALVRSVLPVFLLDRNISDVTAGTVSGMPSPTAGSVSVQEDDLEQQTVSIADGPIEVSLFVGTLKGLGAPTSADIGSTTFRIVATALHDGPDLFTRAVASEFPVQELTAAGTLTWSDPFVFETSVLQGRAVSNDSNTSSLRLLLRLIEVDPSAADGTVAGEATVCVSSLLRAKPSFNVPLVFQLVPSFSHFDELRTTGLRATGSFVRLRRLTAR
jgi:hypothetical protein